MAARLSAWASALAIGIGAVLGPALAGFAAQSGGFASMLILAGCIVGAAISLSILAIQQNRKSFYGAYEKTKEAFIY